MMNFFQTNALLVVILIAIMAVLIVPLSMTQEYAIAMRKKIGYDNYKRYAPWFKQRINISVIILGGAVLVLGVLSIIAFAGDPTVSVYIFGLIPVCLFACLAVVLAVTTSRNNRDLSFFDGYYNDLSAQLGGGNSAISKIENLREKLHDTKKGCTAIVKRLGVDQAFDIDAIYADASAALDSSENNISSAEAAAKAQFGELLGEYLTCGAYSHSKIITDFTAFGRAQFESAMDTAKRNFASLAGKAVEEKLLSGSYTQFSDIISVAACFADMGYKPGEPTTVKLLQAASAHPEPMGVAMRLASLGAITRAVVDFIVASDYHWCYCSPLIDRMTASEIERVLGEIIRRDQSQSCAALMSCLSGAYVSMVEDLIAGAPAKNKAAQTAKAHVNLLKEWTSFYSAPARVENLAVAVREYYRRNRVNSAFSARIEQIVSASDFVRNEGFIVKTYQGIFDRLRISSLTITQIYTIYTSSLIAENTVLDSRRVAHLIKEYTANLCEKELEVLGLIMAGMVLATASDDQTASDMRAAADKMLAGKYKNVTSTAQVGKEILAELFLNSESTLMKVLNRAEKQRLSYERLGEMI